MLLPLALIGFMVLYLLPKFTDVTAVWGAVTSLTWIEAVTLLVAAGWNLATYCLVMVTTTPGLTYRQAAVATLTGTAVANTLPAGGALGIALSFAMLSSWGFSRSRISVSHVLTGLWNNFVKLGLPVLSVALLALFGPLSTGRALAGLAGAAAMIAAVVTLRLLLRSERSARALGTWAGRVASRLLRLVHRPPVSGWELATGRFRERTALLVHARWPWLTLATLVNQFSLFLVLLLALRQVGVSEREVSAVEVFALFALTRLVTAIPISPGGLGVVELALIAGLVAAGGERAHVAAAVLMYRALTYVLPIPLGVAAYVFWQRNGTWRREPNAAPRTHLVPQAA